FRPHLPRPHCQQSDVRAARAAGKCSPECTERGGGAGAGKLQDPALLAGRSRARLHVCPPIWEDEAPPAQAPGPRAFRGPQIRPLAGWSRSPDLDVPGEVRAAEKSQIPE
ncbi:hypothetical protein FKM82_022274, partial [Ascaphus truei]